MYMIGQQTGPLTVAELRRLRAHLFEMNRPGPHMLVLTPRQFAELQRDVLAGPLVEGAAIPTGRLGRVVGFDLEVPEELPLARVDQRRDFYEFARQAVGEFGDVHPWQADLLRWGGAIAPPPPRPPVRTSHSGWPEG